MANVNFPGGREGYVDARFSAAGVAGVTKGSLHDAESANFKDVATMRTRLAAISASYYTTARLDQMSDNDMVYALRVAGADGGASIQKAGRG